jgi:tetratricopeptide (TPR) repeat protein
MFYKHFVIPHSMVNIYLTSKDSAGNRNRPNGSDDGKKRKYKGLHVAFLASTLACSVYAGNNALNWHNVDKYISKPVLIAANVPSIDGAGDLNMRKALEQASQGLPVSPLENSAIIWETELSSINSLDMLLTKATERTKQLEQLKQSFDTGEASSTAPAWVKSAVQNLTLSDAALAQSPAAAATLQELAKSEYGLRIASEYEALNSVVGGGTRTSGKSLEEKHKSLLETLGNASGLRSMIMFQADDYKQAHSHVFVGYLLANMGDLDSAITHFRQAKEIMDSYSDDKNVSLIRDTPELSQRTIKGLIDSSITELDALNDDPAKYSSGWWKRLTYYNYSIGGQASPSILDISENIADRYWDRAFYGGILAVISFYVAGFFGRRHQLSRKYHVGE